MERTSGEASPKASAPEAGTTAARRATQGTAQAAKSRQIASGRPEGGLGENVLPCSGQIQR